MSKSEARKCPECGNMMTRGILSVEGYVSWRINWRKKELKVGLSNIQGQTGHTTTT